METTTQNKFIQAEEYKIEESLYKPDLEAAIKYQEFSSELLRISIISIGVIGFFITNLSERFSLQNFKIYNWLSVKFFLILGLSSLVLSCTSSLFHRYYSTESMVSIIRFLRCSHISLNSQDTARRKHYEKEKLKENERKNKLFKWCTYLINLSIIFLILGAGSLIISFICAVQEK